VEVLNNGGKRYIRFAVTRGVPDMDVVTPNTLPSHAKPVHCQFMLHSFVDNKEVDPGLHVLTSDGPACPCRLQGSPLLPVDLPPTIPTLFASVDLRQDRWDQRYHGWVDLQPK